MLGVKTYTPEFVSDCRSRIEQHVRDFSAILPAQGSAAVETFEAGYSSDLVLLLDYLFVHRLRVVEGKDGNPLNEVRMLANSILTNKGVMLADKGIKLTPANSLLGYTPGDEIRLDKAAFTRLCDAYFAEIEARFV